MPSHLKKFPQLNTPGTFVPPRVAERREDKKEARELKLEIAKWKSAKTMRRSMIGKGFFLTAKAICDSFPDRNYMEFAEAREANWKGADFRELRKLMDKYVNSKVEDEFGPGCLVNPEKRLCMEEDQEDGEGQEEFDE